MHKSYKAMRVGFAGALLLALASAFTARADAVAEKSMSYAIQPGDVLQISVWKEPDLQVEALVRPDGEISFPLVSQLTAAGKSVDEVRQAITDKLQKYIPDPMVSVTVKAIGGSRFFVLGKVNRPGVFALSTPTDVMQALSLAGGTTPFADVNDIRILRHVGDNQTALSFRYGDVEKGKALEQNVLLLSGDTVVVP